MSYRMPRRHYADIYGPTTGDRVRLADTDLVAEVERDHTVYGDECKFGGGKVLRDGMGQAAGVGDDRALDLVITNALDHRLDRHLQGRRRREARANRRHRQGRQSRRDGRRLAGSHRRRDDRGDRGRRTHPDGRRHRRAHSLHLPAANRRRARERRDDVHRRRHRPGDRHQGDDVHAGVVVSRADAPVDRRVADEFRVSRQRQQLDARRAARADSSRRDRAEAARRLGLDAGRHRLLSLGRRRSTTCRWRSTPTRSTNRASWTTRSRRSRGARFTPITPRAPEAATPPTSSACAANRTCCRARPIPPGRSPSTRSTSTSTC